MTPAGVLPGRKPGMLACALVFFDYVTHTLLIVGRVNLDFNYCMEGVKVFFCDIHDEEIVI
jgi:hypothetical protein